MRVRAREGISQMNGDKIRNEIEKGNTEGRWKRIRHN